MGPLVVQVGRAGIACGIIKISISIKEVKFRSPDIAAPRRVRVGINYLRLSCLQPLDGLRTSKLQVVPLCRDEIVPATGVDHLGIASAGAPDRIRKGAHEAKEASKHEASFQDSEESHHSPVKW